MNERIKILIVEDSNLIRFKVKSIFEMFDVDVLELNNAEDLFRFSKLYQKVNLIILDINLPNLNGIEALENMQQDKAWAHTPVIMLTSRADRNSVQKALKAGAIDFIRKPFTDNDVLERVKRILGALPLAGDNEDIWSFDEIEKQLTQELERAKRGNYSLSIIKISPSSVIENMSVLIDQIKVKEVITEELRRIDIAFISPNHNLVLFLPLTNTSGAAFVIEKISKKLEKKIETVTITYPDDSINMDEIMNKIRR
ncbi:MAG TPA: response regulator [Mobilitalea sp.]|nr:response regulator [Mobilitalea sp.]